MKNLITAAALFVIVACAQARLGETNVQIANRYGPVDKRETTGTNTWNATYIIKGEYLAIVYYVDNRSICEAIQPITERRFSEEEINTFLLNIGGGQKSDWRKMPTSGALTTDWRNTRTLAHAQHTKKIMGADMIIICTREYVERFREEKKKQDQEKTSAF